MKKLYKTRLIIKNIVIITALFLFAENYQIYGQKTWDGGAGTSNWGDANNWNPNGVPGLSDDVTISNNGNLTINVNGSYSCNSLNLFRNSSRHSNSYNTKFF